MRAFFLAAAVMLATVSVTVSADDDAKAFSTQSPISELVANEEAKAVLEKHIPQLVQSAGQIGGQSLRQIQPMAAGYLTDDLLAQIDADLAKIK